jgi:hypothetical protein
MVAAGEGRLPFVEALFGAGTEVDARDQHGGSACVCVGMVGVCRGRVGVCARSLGLGLGLGLGWGLIRVGLGGIYSMDRPPRKEEERPTQSNPIQPFPH